MQNIRGSAPPEWSTQGRLGGIGNKPTRGQVFMLDRWFRKKKLIPIINEVHCIDFGKFAWIDLTWLGSYDLESRVNKLLFLVAVSWMRIVFPSNQNSVLAYNIDVWCHVMWLGINVHHNQSWMFFRVGFLIYSVAHNIYLRQSSGREASRNWDLLIHESTMTIDNSPWVYDNSPKCINQSEMIQYYSTISPRSRLHTLIIPICACYYLELRNAFTSHSRVHFFLTKVQHVVWTS